MSQPARKRPGDDAPDPARPGSRRGSSGRESSTPITSPTPTPSGGNKPSNLTALRLVAMREHSLNALFELSHELSVSLDADALAEIAMLNLMGHAGTARAALWLKEEAEPSRLVLTRVHGLTRDSALALGGVLEGLLGRWSPESSMPVLVTEAPERLDPVAASLAERLGLDVLAPVFASNQVVGCAALGPRATGAAYNGYDLEVLRTSLGMLGSAISNARLYRRVRDQYEQLARAEAERRELDRMKAEFLQNVNHELRTPLSVIGGAMECLLGEAEADPRRERLLRAVYEQSGRLREMVQSLLEFASSVEDAGDLKRAPFDPRAALLAYAEDCRARVEGSGRVLVVTTDPLPAVLGDVSRLSDILDPLVGNAIKFSSPGMRIELRAAIAGPAHVRLSVLDEGPGVPAPKRAAIFEAFSQGDGSTTRSVGGLGLGLATARRWAELMGGALQLEDTTGPGATFSLLLPRA
jgi:signal transduction histidine kinase